MMRFLLAFVLLCSPVLGQEKPVPPVPPEPNLAESATISTSSNRALMRSMFDESADLGHRLYELSRKARYMRFDVNETLGDIEHLNAAIGNPVPPMVKPTPIYPTRPTPADPREETKPGSVEPEPVIVPTLTLPDNVTGEVGEFIRIRATTNAESVAWRMCDKGLNLFPPEDLKTTLTAIVTSQRPGTYKLLGVAAIGGKTVFAEMTVTVKGAAPPVVIPPVPPVVVIPDPPAPPVVIPAPVEKFGLLTFTRTLVLANVPPEKRNACAGFAANYSLVVARISSNAVTTFAQATRELSDANRVTAGGDLELWTIVVRELSVKLKQLDQDAAFDRKNLDDVRQAFSEIAAGFLAGGR